MPGIVGHRVDARVRVRPVGVQLPPEPEDGRVDFDGVDAGDAVLERRRDVRARTGAENQDLLEVVAEHHVRPLVEVLLRVDRRHRLVPDVVHLDHGLLPDRLHGDLVVRRPDRPALHVEDEPAGDHEAQHGGERPGRPALVAEERGGRHEGDDEPGTGRRLEPGGDGEARHAGQTAREIDGVGPQRRQRRHLGRHPLREGGEERRDAHEQHGQQQRGLDRGHGVARSAREVDAARCVDAHFQAKEIDRRDDAQQQRRVPEEERSLHPAQQRADADAEERGQQDEVREVREQANLSGQPPDERDLEEEHEERGQEDAQRCREHPGILAAWTGSSFGQRAQPE